MKQRDREVIEKALDPDRHNRTLEEKLSLKVKTFKEQYKIENCAYIDKAHYYKFYTCDCVGDAFTQICETCVEHCHHGEGHKPLLISPRKDIEEKKNQGKKALGKESTNEEKFICECGKYKHEDRTKKDLVKKLNNYYCFYEDCLKRAFPKFYYKKYVGEENDTTEYSCKLCEVLTGTAESNMKKREEAEKYRASTTIEEDNNACQSNTNVNKNLETMDSKKMLGKVSDEVIKEEKSEQEVSIMKRNSVSPFTTEKVSLGLMKQFTTKELETKNDILTPSDANFDLKRQKTTMDFNIKSDMSKRGSFLNIDSNRKEQIIELGLKFETPIKEEKEQEAIEDFKHESRKEGEGTVTGVGVIAGMIKLGNDQLLGENLENQSLLKNVDLKSEEVQGLNLLKELSHISKSKSLIKEDKEMKSISNININLNAEANEGKETNLEEIKMTQNQNQNKDLIQFVQLEPGQSNQPLDVWNQLKLGKLLIFNV